MRLFSLVPLVWESNPKLQGGWCKTQPPAHRGIRSQPSGDLEPTQGGAGTREEPGTLTFADGPSTSLIFVPILSKAALAPWTHLTVTIACDNVLLEYQMAMELKHHGDVHEARS
jgi:hypothetical protein